MEAAAALRSTLLRSLLVNLEKPLNDDQLSATSKLIVGSGLLSAGPDGSQGGPWASIAELQGKVLELLVKQVGKAEASFRQGAATLLGVACGQVPARVFVTSYGAWAGALLEALRKDASAESRIAILRVLGQLFTRAQELLEVPGVRREASALGGRTLQQATPLLAEPACQEAALVAVHSVLNALPTVARNHAATIEQQLAALMADAATPPAARLAAARALALLPRAAADDAPAWSAACRRTLISLHAAIDVLLFHGGGGEGPAAADGGLGARAREQLGAGPGGEAVGLLGGLFPPAAGPRPSVAHTVQVTSALLEALDSLLVGGAASPVPVPSPAVVLLVMRLLKMDASVLLAPGRVAPSSSAQAEVLALLPRLHAAAWLLLGQLCRVARSTLLPLLAVTWRLAGDHLRRVKAGGAGGLAVVMPAAVRRQLYGACVLLLRTGGMAVGKALAGEAVGALVTELYGLSAVQQQQQQQAAGQLGGGSGSSLLRGPPAKKARTGQGAGGGGGGGSDPLAGAELAVAAQAAAAIAPVATADDRAAQAAALGLAEALLQAAGPALPTDLRAQLDALTFHIAAVAADAASRAAREPGAAAAARAGDIAALRLPATRALVASLASPWPSRPPFLWQALALLEAGAAGCGGLELAGVCREGLLALEGLLRPRAAPLGGAAAGGGPALPRPRMWSMLDPMPAPGAGVAPAPAAAAALPAAGKAEVAKAVSAAPQAAEAAAGGAAGAAAPAAAQRQAGKQAEAAAPAAAAPAAPAAAGKRGAGAAPAPPASAAKGGKRQRAAKGGGALAKEEAPAKVGGEAGSAAAAAATAATAARTGAAPAPPAAAPAPAPVTAVLAAPPAAAAAAFGEESDDSEGSLPEIDSGSGSGSEEEE